MKKDHVHRFNPGRIENCLRPPQYETNLVQTCCCCLLSLPWHGTMKTAVVDVELCAPQRLSGQTGASTALQQSENWTRPGAPVSPYKDNRRLRASCSPSWWRDANENSLIARSWCQTASELRALFQWWMWQWQDYLCSSAVTHRILPLGF